MYPHHPIGRRIHYCRSICKRPSAWLMELRSLRVAEKPTHEGVQYERSRRSQEDHWMGDNPREKYLQDRLIRVHTGPPRI